MPNPCFQKPIKTCGKETLRKHLISWWNHRKVNGICQNSYKKPWLIAKSFQNHIFSPSKAIWGSLRGNYQALQFSVLDCLEITMPYNGASIVDSILIDMLSIYIKKGDDRYHEEKQRVCRLYIVC